MGLSIGGLYAARAVLGGARAEGLVLLNTLREIGPRIDWINHAMARIVAHGGVGLFLDALFPLLVNADFAAQARSKFLTGDYAPLPPEHGHMNLMRNAARTDWALDWGALALPTLVITGLQDRVFLDTRGGRQARRDPARRAARGLGGGGPPAAAGGAGAAGGQPCPVRQRRSSK